MADMTTMSIHLPVELKDQMEFLAKATRRSKSFYAVEAIRAYLENETWQVEAIRKGIQSADNGRLVDHSDVMDWVDSWDTNHSGN